MVSADTASCTEAVPPRGLNSDLASRCSILPITITITITWYSCAVPKPIYESSEALTFWDVPVYAEHTIVKANRVDAGSLVGCGDVLSVDGASGKEVRGEDGQVRATAI